MATWRKGESFSRALGREGRDILKNVGMELLSIATLGFFKPQRFSKRKRPHR
jgi:hypothetical protein